MSAQSNRRIPNREKKGQGDKSPYWVTSSPGALEDKRIKIVVRNNTTTTPKPDLLQMLKTATEKKI
jgi:hypothetical protein